MGLYWLTVRNRPFTLWLPDVAVLLPLYMASQLYKDDDNSIATIYRNEFEVARGELVPAAGGVATGEWAVKDGWC